MTQLLVSVRNASEACLAVSVGVHLIDVKEPSRGPLGAADPCVLADVVREVGTSRPVSVALGEVRKPLNQLPITTVPPGVQYAKIGLAGCSKETSWRQQWKQRLSMLPQSVDSVAVIYADWKLAQSPNPVDIVTTASQIGCRAVLVDTYDKGNGCLTQLMTIDDLLQLGASVRRAGLKFVLAGSLTSTSIQYLAPIRPDYFAVRGAACQRGNRCDQLDEIRIRSLLDIIDQMNDDCDDLRKVRADTDRRAFHDS